jgi:cytochrome P450
MVSRRLWRCTARADHELPHLLEAVESDYSAMGLMLPLGATPAARRRLAARERIVAFFDAEICERLGSHDSPDDFMAAMIELERSTAKAMDEAVLRRLAVRMMGVMLAAHTNTAMTILSTLLELLSHPRHLATVRAEVQAAGGLPTSTADIARLPHLHRCITENLRLRSVGSVWRHAERGIRLGDYQVPRGSLVGTSLGLINLDPALYPDPHRFDPDRFRDIPVDRYESPDVDGIPPVFAGFGGGHHRCPGRSVAYAVTALALARLATEYDWTVLARPKRWMRLFAPGVSRPVGDVRLAWKKRDPARATG